MIDLQPKNSFLKKSVAFTAFFFTFSLFATQIAIAQINNNRFRVNLNSLDMGPCGGPNDSHSRIGVLAKNNTVNNFEIAFDLPDGVNFIPGTERITFQQGSSDFTLTVVDMSNLNAPVFRLERPGNANWEVADLVRFRFDKTASCDAVTFSYGGGLFKDAHTITYDDLNGPQSASDTDPTINSYNFLRAYLAVLNYNNITARVDDVVTRPIEVTNSGNGNITSFTHNVVVGSSLGSYTLAFNGSSLTPTSVSGSTYSYTIDFSQAPFAGNIGDGDSEFENETVFLEETFAVLDCNDLDIGHQPTWGCNPLEICQALEPVSAAVVVNEELPEINVTKINDPSNTDLCLATTYTVRISNDAPTAIAYNVEINTGFGTNSSILTSTTENGMWGNDRPNNTKSLSNFRFGSNPSFTPVQRPSTQYTGTGAGSYFVTNTLFSSDPDGPGGLEDLDGDGFFDDMAPGESTDLLYDHNVTSNSNSCGENYASYVSSYYLRSDAYANNQCDNFSPTGREFLTNASLARGASSPSAPTDIFDGVGFNVGIQGILSTGGTDPLFCNGTRMFSNDPSSSWTVTMNVPDGISLDGTPAGFTQVNPNTIVYSTTNLPAVNYLDMNVDFPLIMDCGVYSGPTNVPITYTTRYECDCFAQDIQCGSVTGIRSQCPSPCNGPAITAFEAQRETAGWTDESMTTRVVLDPNVHNLETYMAKDEMVLHASAVMSNTNPNSLSFTLDYETLGAAAGGADIIQFLNGSITINDLSSGAQTVPITVPPVINTNGTTTHSLTFDLSTYTTAISPTYTYGEPTVPLGTPEADEIDLELHFVFEEDFTTHSFLELNNFSGSFSDENGVSCNILGDRVFYFKNRIRPYDRLSTSTEGCTETFIELLIEQRSVSGDRFPNEYRPPSIWQFSELEIPAGATFTGLVTSTDFQGTDPSTTNGGLTVSQVGNILTITPTSIQEYDQSGNHYPRIRVHLQGSSISAPSTLVNWTTNYEEFSYSSAPVNQTTSDTHNFNFTQPDYSLTSTTPIVSGDRATARFEVDLCMNSPSDIDFNWLQINNGSQFTVLSAYEIVGAAQNPLTFSSNSGSSWVELGQYVGGTTCKKVGFEVAFTECSNFNFTVENAWSCTGYPTDFSIPNYLNPLVLRLEPKEAALQIAIVDEPSDTIDTCSSFNIDIELRNAGNGDLINPIVTFDIPGDATSLVLNGINLEYPRNSGDIQTISSNLTGNTVTLNILDHTAIAAGSGIQGSINASVIDEQIALIQLDLSVQCNFSSNTAFTYEATGYNPCGSPATGNGSRLSTNPLVVTGAEPTYDAISNITVPPGGLFAGCNTETITVQTTIVGGPSSSLDYARIILPDGLAFDETSFVSNNPAYPVSYGSVTTVGNHEEFTVQMPDGANNGADPSYSFDVTLKNTTTTCSPGTRIEVNNYVVTSALTCGAVSCGTTEIANGSTFEDVIITKPELIESTFTTNSDYTTDGIGNYEYHIEFGVENTGTVDIASGFIYNVYCADGAGTRIGSSVYNGTVNQAIPAGSSISEDIFFSTNSFCGDNSNMVVEFVPSDTNCHCDVLSIPLVSEPEVADLEVTSSVNPVNANIGNTVTFTIDVVNNGPFDAENVVIENIVPAGYTITGINDGGTQSGNTITWPQFDLANSNTSSFSFTATVNTPTGAANEFDSISQVVAVDEYDNDSTPNNYDGLPLEDDEAIVSVHVLTSDLVLTKGLSAASNTNPNIGETVTFELLINNNGPDGANNVSIEDVVPSGYTIGIINNGGTVVGNTISWNIANVPVGSMALSYEASLNAPNNVAGEYTNIAQVTASEQYDPNSTPNNDDGDQSENDEANFTLPAPTADLELINTIAPSPVNPGDTVTISVEIINNGPNDATNIEIENIVPIGFTVSNINNSGTQTANVINWNVSNVVIGTSITLTYEAIVNLPNSVVNEYLNTVQVIAVDQNDLDSSPNNDDGDQSEDDEDNASILLNSVDLNLSKGLGAASPTQPNIGDNVIFEITVTNNGSSDASNVSIEDVVPSGYSIGTINDGGTATGNTIIWNITTLSSGNQVLSYEATLNAPTNTPGEYTNIAQITTSDQYDPDSTPNNDDGDQSEDDETSFTIPAPTADLEVINTILPSSANPGDTIIISVEVVNNGTNDATNVAVENIVPSGFTVSNIANSGTQTTNIINWNSLNIPNGTSAILTYEAIVNEPINTVNEYFNTVQVVGVDQGDSDSNPNNDDGDQSEDDEDNATLMLISADLSLTKALSATSNSMPNTGDTLIFELTVTNNGGNVATNVSVEDVVPSGYTIGTINDGGIATGNTISWSLANLTVGSQVLSYEVTMNAPTNTDDEYTNIAQITASDQYDPNSSPNNDDGDQSEDDEANYTIGSPILDLEIVKTVDNLQAVAGDTLLFRIEATNGSLYDATNIGIEDVLPDGFEFISTNTDNGSYDQAIGLWEIPLISAGSSSSLEMSVMVTEIENYTNIAELSYLDQIDDNIANDRDEVTISVTQEECLTVFNEFSPNNDGANDTFFIECIEDYPNNTLQVFNRWGTKVFEMNNYDNSWDGTSQGRATINESEKLPVGTYYYTLEPGDGITPPKAGWLYISR
ncbi:DUF11 domain-containing protein [Maribacter algarum]|uniref:DUF11 domain-containing protein n=1 Tax=Maribacter algarum (ex Zhang et al. 2020) TaxID=2578118 RepID=A0A5S3QM41_9FLAO|nr:gliding motility-associated C-terminal domain-containing protein [Maribacter algarum]TMM58964.1 DUF11 domain-containing protein [Maribacter algarum]